MRQPASFIDRNNENKICKLQNVIYGIHQSGQAWYHEMDHILTNLNLKKIEQCNRVLL